MLGEKIGKVSEIEKNEILEVYERKNALHELLLTLNDDILKKDEKEYLYSKIVTDLCETNKVYNKWWNEISQKYKFKPLANGSWRVDFDTQEVFVQET